MTAMFSPVSFLLLLSCAFFGIVFAETEWVWSKNQSPHISASSGGKNNQNNFGGSSSSFPESPSRPSSQSNFQNNNLNNNGDLPAGSIRVVNSQPEARLIPGAVNFITNALQGGSGGGGGGGGGIGGGNGLISVGGGLLSSILSNGPQIASSALSFLLGRQPSNSNGNNNGNGITTLPANVPSIPTLNPGNGGGGSGFPSSGISSNSGNCRCINLNQCFLPSRPGGSCDGGNIMCCQTSSDTRAILGDSSSLSNSVNPTRSVRTPLDVRVGLIENIYRGTSTIIDDALDLALQRFLTDEDKQKLATRVSNYG